MVHEKNKECVLSIRIDSDLLQELDTIAEKEHLSRSDYIRKAIADAMSFSVQLRKNQTFLINSDMVKYSLGLMDDNDIEEFAILSIQNGREILKDYLGKNLSSSIVQKYLEDNQTIISGLLTFIIQSILGPTSQKWFHRIHFSWHENIVAIIGTHALGLGFSKFMRYYFMHFFDIFNFQEVENKNKIIINEDRIKLEFKGNFGKFDVAMIMK